MWRSGVAVQELRAAGVPVVVAGVDGGVGGDWALSRILVANKRKRESPIGEKAAKKLAKDMKDMKQEDGSLSNSGLDLEYNPGADAVDYMLCSGTLGAQEEQQPGGGAVLTTETMEAIEAKALATTEHQG
ncbi:hypothetical protein NDU88_005616 [Pleurodeles waltl]|uniref:Uncharacterized protein n=1 Tax=Pleurodeles waltl TaxID=8319 RepID=A0AAV7SM53_PLEWA|nr:hypothetical protein NDU88_005616 [Pleurodeles waltl]